MMQSVTIKAPATTANMGPGFDCLGMALDIWNSVTVEVGASGFDAIGEGGGDLPRGGDNLIHRSFRRLYDEIGEPAPQVGARCENAIPLGRGLGSSAAAVASGLMAANALSGANLSKDDLLAVAADIEGHPDNAAAAIFGGCRIVVNEGDRLIVAPVPIPDGISAVLFVPDVPMPTEEARGILPPQVDRSDAVHNIGRAALLVSAFASGDLSLLAVATGDRLHQPARQKIFFPMKNIFRAAMAAGALGVFLSGAGSSALALASEREYTIGYEMADAAMKSGVDGAIKVARPSALGAHISETDG